MEKILAGVREFRQNVYPEQREFFERIAARKQRPIALFITCADSRINPNLITQTEPGDLFLIRSAGNLIPPFGAPSGGEIATIEYTLSVLGIKNIIICGHSQCGAMQAILEDKSLDELPAVRAWCQHAEATKQIVRTKYKDLSHDELIVAATEENVLVQMNNLSTHPYVAARLSTGDIHIYGWYYDIPTGQILQYEQEQGKFVELDGVPAPTSPLPLRTNGNGSAVLA